MRLLICLLVLISTSLYGQKSKTYTLRTIAFYNCENLFDTVNDTLTFDDDRTPEGRYHWTKERYLQKVENLSKVISEIGEDTSKTSPDIVGLCEVENLDVLEDLVQHPNLREKNYGIIHFDSPDARGIDVALLYKKASFIPSSFKSHRLLLFDEMSERKYTRDQLVVGGTMDREDIYFIVNHWPSRRGGATKSSPLRVRAALLNKRIIDSKGKKRQLDSLSLYNPMEGMFKKGVGSLAYRDKWNLFDQIFMTANLVTGDRTTLSFWKAGIFAPSFIRTDNGRFKGYPIRTYSGGSYTAGYSDHFPAYLFLLKEVE